MDIPPPVPSDLPPSSSGVPSSASSQGEVATNKDARLWATIAHLSGLLLHVIPPVGQILGPLIVWIIKKDEHRFVDDQAKEALNFQISMTLYAIIPAFLCLFIIGIPLLILWWIFDVVLTIIAAVKANEGVAYRYPATIRFVK